MQDYKLTRFSPGAGCGCKIAPGVLEDLLRGVSTKPDKKLIVGNEANDDAAVYDLGNEMALLSTTDFFTPIVDDAYDFGRIAATNAISDIFAMGGKPVLSIAILGWPLDKLPVELATEVIRGAVSVCDNAGIPLAGGHSVNIEVPLFGLAVNGLVNLNHVKRNNTARGGDIIYLTKPLGIGIVTTAQKKELVSDEDISSVVNLMLTLNKPGEEFGKLSYVTAMTDVTGFGLAGHMLEMLNGNRLSAEINYRSVPLVCPLEKYIGTNCIPGGTFRNIKSYGNRLVYKNDQCLKILCDPQTSGGLLVAVDKFYKQDFEKKSAMIGCDVFEIGSFISDSTIEQSKIFIKED